jgi:acyl phosphate:glycerol-3-phosphate acyltransferase
MTTGLIAVVLAYVLGAIPFGYLLVKWKTGADVRKAGSGNIGATNVLRTTGPVAGVATLLLDFAKGYLAVWLAGRLTASPGVPPGPGDPFWMSAAALAAMVGHIYPVFLGFHGGKAVATFIGAFLCLTPLPMVAILVVFLGVVLVTRQISMGSIVAAAVFPLGVWLIQKPPLVAVISAAVAAALIIYRHRSNLERLYHGTEPTFRFGGGSGR